VNWRLAGRLGSQHSREVLHWPSELATDMGWVTHVGLARGVVVDSGRMRVRVL
jgi:hypothetical protein